eukprot:scaffold33893_cov27-Tisochrysis_lutea.AAC.1
MKKKRKTMWAVKASLKEKRIAQTEALCILFAKRRKKRKSLGHSDAPKGLGKKETASSKGKEQALNGQAGSYGPRKGRLLGKTRSTLQKKNPSKKPRNHVTATI